MSFVLALVPDLFFQVKLQAAARQASVELKMATTGEALLAAVRESPPALVIVDLNLGEIALSAVQDLRKENDAVPVLGFLSHVEVELAERARVAGCTEVMPRSKFAQNLPTILARARL